MKPTIEQLAKLPKWAQDHIKTLQRERDTAVRALNEWRDTQTPSSIYTDELLSMGEEGGPSFKRRYIQGRKLTFIHAGIRLDVNTHFEDVIKLQWDSEKRTSADIALIPASYQAARLVHPSNMRE